MTHLNAPGAVIIPAPSNGKPDRRGRHNPPVPDLLTGIRLLALGFWHTHTTDKELDRLHA